MTERRFHHPHDTPLSAGFRFLTELIAWVAGPWMASLWSSWLIVPAVVLLVGLPAVFSTPRDKNQVIVRTPGPIRVGIELLLYGVAAVAPWFVWSPAWAGVATAIVVIAIVTGVPRMLWLFKGAPEKGCS